MLKEDTGPKGLYGQTEEKLVIELSKPEVIRIIEEFEYSTFTQWHSENIEHPESSKAEQDKFLRQLCSLQNLVDQELVINPYGETDSYLKTLDTGECVDPKVATCLQALRNTGQAMYQQFVKDRIEDCKVPLTDVISKPNLYTFLRPPPVNLSKGSDNMPSYKSTAAIVTQMFVSLQARPDSDMDEFFMYENAREPPSLSSKGKLRSGTKSQIVGCLPGVPERGRNPAAKQATVLILDMAAVVHLVTPKHANVFGEYSEQHLIPFIESQMSARTDRVDAVWDRYIKDSLKNQTRLKRTGEIISKRRKVAESIPIPKGKHWADFLKNSDNKEELFTYLADELLRLSPQFKYSLVVTKGELALSNDNQNLADISPTDHEEADTRLMLHLQHAINAGHHEAAIRTVDSDIVVLSVHFFPIFQRNGLEKLWISYGKGKSYTDIPIHEVAAKLGPAMCEAILFFHAFTGSDMSSSMMGIGKKTAWKTWMDNPQFTQTMIAITQRPHEMDETSVHMENIEAFTVQMYNKNSDCKSVNAARRHLFTHSLQSLERIPPTKAALYQHTKRALLVSAHIWHCCLNRKLNLPDPKMHGWEWHSRLEIWVPYWTSLGDASTACALLLHCGCTKSCKGNCKCFKSAMRCTPLCKCEGGCCNNSND